MAMHKPKKIKRFQPGGLVDSEGRPVRDGSGQPIMTGSFPEEDEITARGRAKNAEMFKSLFNRATGRGKSAQDEAGKVAQMEAAKEKLAGEVQSMVKAKGDSDRLSYDAEQGAKAPEAASAKMPAKAKSGIVTKEELEKSGLSLRDYMNKQRGLTRRDGKAPVRAGEDKKPKASGAMIQSMDTDVMRTNSRTAAKAAGASRRAKAESEAKAKDKKTFGALTRTETNRAQREAAMRDDKATYKKGGSVSSASKRADGIAQRGKTRGKVY
jgi:hypothetical protein